MLEGRGGGAGVGGVCLDGGVAGSLHPLPHIRHVFKAVTQHEAMLKRYAIHLQVPPLNPPAAAAAI